MTFQTHLCVLSIKLTSFNVSEIADGCGWTDVDCAHVDVLILVLIQDQQINDSSYI